MLIPHNASNVRDFGPSSSLSGHTTLHILHCKKSDFWAANVPAEIMSSLRIAAQIILEKNITAHSFASFI